ncbi:MAG: hypothetical protein MUC43_16255 [Pirellula sp.]|jgi:hypothetical protein|nr:hypothetical protein [Pirellula sp.]
MLTRITLAAIAGTLLVQIVVGQEKPIDTDSKAYKKAYELIFDVQARAKMAEELLLENGKKKLSDLSAKELSLLCRIYNEVFNPEKQLKTAQEIWDRFPESPDATRWMVNSMLNKMMNDNDIQETLAFVDKALSEKKGIRSELLVLKARAILQRQKKLTDAERRVMVADLLIEAYACYDKSEGESDFPDLENVGFVDMDHSFTQYFSTVEREALKVRMRAARDARK